MSPEDSRIPFMRYHDPEEDTAACYAANTLNAADRVAFEQHLLTCESCRNEVRLASLVRSELPAQSRRPNPWVVGAGLALAASFALIMTRSSGKSLQDFGRVAAAPEYNGIAVRGAIGGTDSLFALAMKSYRAHDYSSSARQFAAARSAGADSVTTTFFLGVSNLIADDAAGAATELRRSVAMNRSSYTSESHYYLAKALLSQGNREDALRELEAAAESESTIQSAAKFLGDSIKAMR